MKKFYVISFILICLTIKGYSQLGWEGNAIVGDREQFGSSGLFAASNAFTDNTIVRIINLDSERQTRVIIKGRVNEPGIFTVLSPQAAVELGVTGNAPARVRLLPISRAVTSLDPLNEQPFHPDPDINPAAGLIDVGSTAALPERQAPEPPTLPPAPDVPKPPPRPDPQIEQPIIQPPVPPETSTLEPPALPEIPQLPAASRLPSPRLSEPRVEQVVPIIDQGLEPLPVTAPVPDSSSPTKPDARTPIPAVTSIASPAQPTRLTPESTELVAPTSPLQSPSSEIPPFQTPRATSLSSPVVGGVPEIHSTLLHPPVPPIPFDAPNGELLIPEEILEEAPATIDLVPPLDPPIVPPVEESLPAAVEIDDGVIVTAIGPPEAQEEILNGEVDIPLARAPSTEEPIANDGSDIGISPSPLPSHAPDEAILPVPLPIIPAEQDAGVQPSASSGAIELRLDPTGPRPPSVGDDTTIDTVESPPPASLAIPPSNRDTDSGLPIIQVVQQDSFYLQVGAFSSRLSVRSVVSQLSNEKFPVSVLQSPTGRQPLYRVLIGPLGEDEQGAYLYSVRVRGYGDAFVRKGSELL